MTHDLELENHSDISEKSVLSSVINQWTLFRLLDVLFRLCNYYNSIYDI